MDLRKVNYPEGDTIPDDLDKQLIRDLGEQWDAVAARSSLIARASLPDATTAQLEFREQRWRAFTYKLLLIRISTAYGLNGGLARLGYNLTGLRETDHRYVVSPNCPMTAADPMVRLLTLLSKGKSRYLLNTLMCDADIRDDGLGDLI